MKRAYIYNENPLTIDLASARYGFEKMGMEIVFFDNIGKAILFFKKV
jgi:hypothetical protein